MSDTTNKTHIDKADAEWRSELTPERYRVLRENEANKKARDAAWTRWKAILKKL